MVSWISRGYITLLYFLSAAMEAGIKVWYLWSCLDYKVFKIEGEGLDAWSCDLVPAHTWEVIRMWEMSLYLVQMPREKSLVIAHDDVHELPHKHIGQGGIVDRLWRKVDRRNCLSGVLRYIASLPRPRDIWQKVGSPQVDLRCFGDRFCS
ncbi:hypothetical protein D1007_12075 [Hordeum vulgare]|nr:hypothetical protein D1007_12075 [Hordeum vulgare]